MKAFAFLRRAAVAASLTVLAIQVGCCHHGGACGPSYPGVGGGGGCYGGNCGYGPGATFPQGAYYQGATTQAAVPIGVTASGPVYPVTAAAPINQLPTF